MFAVIYGRSPAHIRHSLSLLSYQMQPKPVGTSSEAETRDKEQPSKLSGALSSSIFSVGDLFRDTRDGSKTARFGKDLPKVLEQKLQDIAMGKDPAYVVRSLSSRGNILTAEKLF